MAINQQPKVSMHVVNNPSETPGSEASAIARGADAEVIPRARRRRCSNADKRRILEAADRCTQPGEIGALLRREGVYSSSLSTWRHWRRKSAGSSPM